MTDLELIETARGLSDDIETAGIVISHIHPEVAAL